MRNAEALAALVVYWLTLNRTTLGYEVRAVGFNPDTTAGVGETVSYEWFADTELGATNLLDYGDVIVHIFRPEVREFYNLEKMWQADFAADVLIDGETIAAIRHRYPDRRLWAIFEPRSNTSRRNIHQEDYAHAFTGANRASLKVPERHDKVPVNEELDVEAVAVALRQRGIDASAVDVRELFAVDDNGAAVGMLELQDQIARVLVIDAGRASPGKGARPARTGCRTRTSRCGRVARLPSSTLRRRRNIRRGEG